MNLKYRKLNDLDLNQWNKILLKTDASYFQYPYFSSGNSSLPFSSSTFYVFYNEEIPIGFASVMDVKFLFLKIGLIIRGPVVFDSEQVRNIITLLNRIQRKERYFFIRINPNFYDKELIELLEKDSTIFKKDYFPIYKGSQSSDLLIDTIGSETELMMSYKNRARQSIRYGLEEDYEISKSNSIEDLKEAYNLFIKVAKNKNFNYRAFESYSKILENGAVDNLASLYIAKKNGIMVNALFIVKDKNTFTYFSGGLIEGDYRPRNSPASLLQHNAISDCLLIEKKQHYNISNTTKTHSVYTFKSSFNPVEKKYPGYYVISSKTFSINIFYLFVIKLFPKAKKIIRMKFGNKVK